jgi:hypothetical protein
MRFRDAIATLAALVIIPVIAGPALGEVLITINKSTQQMTVLVDGAPRYRWPVSTGVPGRETPAGSFQPFRMEEEHYSKEWDDAPMPHSIFFTQVGHAIHGSEHRLGTPASHGCVRISPASAAKLYALVEQEGLPMTRVVITGTEPSPGNRVATGTTPGQPSRKRRWTEENDGRDLYGQNFYEEPFEGDWAYHPYRSYPENRSYRGYRTYPEDRDTDWGWE